MPSINVSSGNRGSIKVSGTNGSSSVDTVNNAAWHYSELAKEYKEQAGSYATAAATSATLASEYCASTQAAMTSAESIISSTTDAILTTINNKCTESVSIINATTSASTTEITNIFNACKGSITTATTNGTTSISNATTNGLGSISTLATEATSSIQAVGTSVVNETTSAVAGLTEGTVTSIQAVGTSVVSATTSSTSAITTEAVGSVNDAKTSALNTISSAVTNGTESISNATTAGLGSINTLATEVTTSIGTLGTNYINTINTLGTSYTNTINSIGTSYTSTMTALLTSTQASTTEASIWAEGTSTDVEALGGTRSSKGWAEYAETVIGSAIKPKESISSISALPTLTSNHLGWMYNFSAEFTTTSDFVEGANKKYPAGTNVVVVEYSTGNYKYDVFSGFVDTTAYNNHIANTTIHVTSTDKTTWNGKQDKLIQGSNITISGNTISATDTTYTNGTGLNLSGTTFSVDFTEVATATQGGKADTALQQSDVLSTYSATGTAPINGTAVASAISGKQDTLTQGTGITISANNTIATGIYYATSDTAADEPEKEVSIPSITQLREGQIIIVKPSVTSTVANSTLKLNGFEAYPMIYNNAAITTSTDSYVWSANYPSAFVFDGTYWVFLCHGVDSNTTYTINYSVDAGKYTAGVGTYAISTYCLCLQKPDGTWEKPTDTTKKATTGTTKTVNTNGFLLNQIRYYNGNSSYGSTSSNGVAISSNILQQKAASVDLRYSTNCGGTPNWTAGEYIYLVGTMGVDGLFYLDTTAWWTNTLPSTNDGKLYIRLGLVLTTDSYTMSFFDDRPIFYHDGTKLCEYRVADNKQDVITDLATIRAGATAGATALQQSDVTSSYSASGTLPINGTGVADAISTKVSKSGDSMTGDLVTNKAIYLTSISNSVSNSISRLYFGPKSSPYNYITANNTGVFSIHNSSAQGISCYPTQNLFATTNIDLGRSNNKWKDIYANGKLSTGNSEMTFDSIIAGATAGSTALQQSNVTSSYSASGTVPINGTGVASAISDMATQTWVGNQGYLTTITSSNVTTALGYTPYNSTNPSGYQANVIETIKVNGTAQTVTTKTVNITVPATPTVGNGNMVIQRNGTAVGTFTANQTSASTINISVPTTATEVGALSDTIPVQTTSNLVTSVSSASTDAQYPSAKLFYDTCGDIETLINAL